jgi:phosphoenolpyruvate carboxylase
MAVTRHAETVLRHYLTEVHLLGAELSMSRTLTPCTPALSELAAQSADASPHRLDEPYRRALTASMAALPER